MKLIDENKLLEEFKKLKQNLSTSPIIVIEDVESLLESLEAKEMDLEKELSLEDYKSFFKKYPDLSDDWGFNECWVFAKYFYELGLQVSNKTQKGE